MPGIPLRQAHPNFGSDGIYQIFWWQRRGDPAQDRKQAAQFLEMTADNGIFGEETIQRLLLLRGSLAVENGMHQFNVFGLVHGSVQISVRAQVLQ